VASRNKDQKTVVILGAARSGTSVTAGVLDILGVDLGQVVPPDESNPRGYFEDYEVVDFITEILDEAGFDFINPPTYKKFLGVKSKYDDKIKKFFVRKGKNKEIWGWKVVYTILTIELFLPYLVNPHFVVVFRNPLDTAKSLVKRRKIKGYKKINFLHALKLTNFYTKEMIDFLDRHPKLPRVLVAYEGMLKNPVKEAEKLAVFLNIKLTDDKKERVAKFVTPGEELESEKKKAAFLRPARFIFFRVKRFVKKTIENPTKIPLYIKLVIKNNLSKS
jgi:hypothetical protein